jgi:hypothetical protein
LTVRESGNPAQSASVTVDAHHDGSFKNLLPFSEVYVTIFSEAADQERLWREWRQVPEKPVLST